MNTLAVFKSRTQALAVYNYLLSQKIACTTISTPARFNLGCGISIVFPSAYADKVKTGISRLNAGSFIGFFAK